MPDVDVYAASAEPPLLSWTMSHRSKDTCRFESQNKRSKRREQSQAPSPRANEHYAPISCPASKKDTHNAFCSPLVQRSAQDPDEAHSPRLRAFSPRGIPIKS